jgi:4-amino-4-deoxy-L-arabinose transferase-like glycosyltransferase
VTYPLTGLPWSPFVILATVTALRRRDRRGELFLALAVASTVALFSLASGKLAVYLLPMFPAAALLTADHLARGGRWARACLTCGALASLALGLAVASLPWWRPGLASPPWMVAVAGLGLAAPAAVAAALALRTREVSRDSVTALAVAGAAFVIVTVPLGSHMVDPQMSIAPVARAVVAAEPGAADGVIYLRNYPGLWLYSERPFTVLAGPDELARSLAGGRWVLIRESDLRRLPAAVLELIAERRAFAYRWKQVLLVRGRA